jgi:hypothetical protein
MVRSFVVLTLTTLWFGLATAVAVGVAVGMAVAG